MDQFHWRDVEAGPSNKCTLGRKWRCKITDDFKEKEDQLFLELIAKNVWKARREAPILGFVYTVLIVALLWATVSLGSLSGISAAIYAACMVLLFDFWRRVFRKP